MIPSYQTLMQPVLETAQNGEVRTRDVMGQLADRFDLTEEERQELLLSGRRTRFADRVSWAKTYLKQAGLLKLTRPGYFAITDRGKKALADTGAKINNVYLKQFSEFIEFQKRTRTSKTDADSPLEAAPEELMEDSDRQLRDKLTDELLENIKALSPERFEYLVVNLVEKMGYGKGEKVGGSGDGGIDGIIDQDPLGLEKVYIQAKRWTNPVGEPEIRNFSGSLDTKGAEKGVFITNSTFSSTATEAAERISAGSKSIRLINGQELANLMIEHSVGVVTERTYEVKKVDENYFAEND